MKNEIKEILDYYQKDIDKYEKSMKNYTEYQQKTTFSKNYQRYKNHKLLLDYITNLQENARGQVNDYFKDKYADEVLKNAKLQEDNEKLEKRNKEIYDGFIATQEELSDYATRNEKYEKVINEIKEKIDDYFGYDYENESQARLDTLNEINYIIVDLYNGGDEE